MSELLPCPFCGQQPAMRLGTMFGSDSMAEYWTIHCTCPLGSPDALYDFDMKNDMITDYNCRSNGVANNCFNQTRRTDMTKPTAMRMITGGANDNPVFLQVYPSDEMDEYIATLKAALAVMIDMANEYAIDYAEKWGQYRRELQDMNTARIAEARALLED